MIDVRHRKCIGALDIFITPENGVFISRIRKIDAATDRLQISNAPVAVALSGANNPKLPNSTVSQQMITTRNSRRAPYDSRAAEHDPARLQYFVAQFERLRLVPLLRVGLRRERENFPNDRLRRRRSAELPRNPSASSGHTASMRSASVLRNWSRIAWVAGP